VEFVFATFLTCLKLQKCAKSSLTANIKRQFIQLDFLKDFKDNDIRFRALNWPIRPQYPDANGKTQVDPLRLETISGEHCIRHPGKRTSSS
jgi:hypothetical protein